MSRPHFHDYHLLPGERSEQIVAMADHKAERARKIGASFHSIRDISQQQRLKDNNEEFATPRSMPAELCADNQQLTRSLRFTHDVCEQHNEVATLSLLENWIDA